MSAPIDYRHLNGSPVTMQRPAAHAALETSPTQVPNPGLADGEYSPAIFTQPTVYTSTVPEPVLSPQDMVDIMAKQIRAKILHEQDGVWYYHGQPVEPRGFKGFRNKEQVRPLPADQLTELRQRTEQEFNGLWQRAEQFRRERYHCSLVERLKYLVNELLIHPVIAAEDGKSSDKTHTMLGVGSQYAWHTRRRVVIFPATRSQSTVTIGAIAGIRRTKRMKTASEFITAVESGQQFSPSEIDDIVGMTNAGVGVFIEDNNAPSLGDDTEAARKFVRAQDVLISNVTIVLNDGANDDPGNGGDATIPRMSARLSHVMVHPFDATVPTTRGTARGTILKFNDNSPFEYNEKERAALKDFEHTERTGLATPLRYKAEHSVIVASRANPTQYSRDDVVSLTLPVDGQSDSDVPLLQWDGDMVVVPEEPSFNQTDEKGELLPFDFFKLGLGTHIGYLEIAVKCCEQAGIVQGNNPFDDKTYQEMADHSNKLLVPGFTLSAVEKLTTPPEPYLPYFPFK